MAAECWALVLSCVIRLKNCNVSYWFCPEFGPSTSGLVRVYHSSGSLPSLDNMIHEDVKFYENNASNRPSYARVSPML